MKKIRIMLAAALLAVLLVPTTAIARDRDSRLQFGLNVNPAIPLGNYGKFDNPRNNAVFSEGEEGGMGFGFGLDFKVSYRLGDNGLMAYAKIGFMVNNLVGGMTDSIQAANKRNPNLLSTNLTMPTMINIPFMVGARYNLDFVGNFGLFAEVGLGLNFYTMTNTEIVQYYYNTIEYETGRYLESTTDTYSAKMGAGFAFELGAGLNLTRWLSLGVYYTNLGTGKLKFEQNRYIEYYSGGTREVDSNVNGGKLTKQMLTIRLGFTF